MNEENNNAAVDPTVNPVDPTTTPAPETTEGEAPAPEATA